MTAPRSEPPHLPDYTYIRGIGAGGFADVFLYLQHQPRRQVALKVARPDKVSDLTVAQFTHEANTMAEVSEHTYIVQIYHSGVAPDGRPYIVMEHYPNEHFGLRSRGGRLPLSLVLEVSVQVASAVATAHKAHILHRDIKPENILTSRLNKPGLTDFGISAVERAGASSGLSGYTPQYAAPEVIADTYATGSELADVYSLGATMYALLAGYGPYYVHDGENDIESVKARVLAGQVQPLQRQDVPPSVWNLIRNTMSADLSARPPSALEFARYVQQIQQEERLRPTEIELLESVVPIEDLDAYLPPPGAPAPGPLPPSLDELPTQGVGLRSPAPPATPTPAGPAPGVPSHPTPGAADLTRAGATPSQPGPQPQDQTRAGQVPSVPSARVGDADATSFGQAQPAPAPPADATQMGRSPSTPPSAPAAAPPLISPPPRPAPVPPPADLPPPVAVIAEPEPAPPASTPATDEPGPNRAPLVIGAAVVGLIVVVLAVLGATGSLGGKGGTATTETSTQGGGGLVVQPPAPSGVEVDRSDPTAVKVTWVAPSDIAEVADPGYQVTWYVERAGGEPVDGDAVTVDGTATSTTFDATSAVEQLKASDRVCAQVSTRDGQTLSEETSPQCA